MREAKTWQGTERNLKEMLPSWLAGEPGGEVGALSSAMGRTGWLRLECVISLSLSPIAVPVSCQRWHWLFIHLLIVLIRDSNYLLLSSDYPEFQEGDLRV